MADGRGTLVDAHVHVWSADTRAYPFGPHDGLEAPHETFDSSRLGIAMDEAGVRGAVAIQPRVYGYDHAYLFDAYRCLAPRLRVVPLLNPFRPSGIEDMEALSARQGVAGFRVIALGREPADPLLGAPATRLWARLAEVGLPVGFLLDPGQLTVVEAVAMREPGLLVVLDHLAGVDPGAWTAWGAALLRLSRLPNVYVKISALGHLSRRPFPFDDLHRPVQELLYRYGPGRLLWGSDWPHAYGYGTYDESARSAVAVIGDLGAEERDRILGGNAHLLYGFPENVL